jgi:hypothetical protein
MDPATEISTNEHVFKLYHTVDSESDLGKPDDDRLYDLAIGLVNVLRNVERGGECFPLEMRRGPSPYHDTGMAHTVLEFYFALKRGELSINSELYDSDQPTGRSMGLETLAEFSKEGDNLTLRIKPAYGWGINPQFILDFAEKYKEKINPLLGPF